MDHTYDFPTDLTPSEVFAMQDPARQWPGGGAPPNFGQEVVPQVFTAAGSVGLAGHAYLNADEAMRHDPANAARMRVDCGIMESLEARQRATALLNWHIEPEEKQDQKQKQLVADLTPIIERSYRFTEWRLSMQNAIWYGRYANANQFSIKPVRGQQRKVMSYWEPRNGDKLVFRFNDGSNLYKSDQVGIKIHTGGMARKYLNRDQIQSTENGPVYWFNDYERTLISVHKHTREDGDYDDPYSSSRIHGVGIRSRIYWTWYAMVECLQRALEYLDRSAFGVELWRYPANNPSAKKKVEDAATRHVNGGRSVILVPTWPGDQADQYGVDHIEPGLQGVDRLLDVIKSYFGGKIKRYILGQTLTSEAEATGMGSGVADAHLATFADIVAYDARNLEESITDEFLQHVQKWNFPWSAGYWLRFRIDTESPNIDARLKALKAAWDMGMGIKNSDIADAAGISVPTAEDEIVFNPQVYMAIKQAAQMEAANRIGANAPPPTTAEQMQAMVMQALAQRDGGLGRGGLSMEDMGNRVSSQMDDNEPLRLAL